MADKQSNVVLNFETNGEVSYAKTVKQINREMNLAATEYKNQVSAMDKDATQTEKLTSMKKKLETQIGLAGERSKILREEYEKSVQETGKYSAESEKLYKKLLDAETGENKLKSALEETNEALKQQGNLSIETADKIAKIEEAGEKVKGVGKGLSVGLTAPIMAIAAGSMVAFNEVDGALDTIITKTGASGDAADSLAESFKKVGSNTHLELQTVGDAIGEVNTQFGFMDEKLEESTDYMLKFAEINGTDVSQSAINARQAIEAYDLSYDDLNMVLDATTKVAQDTGQSVDSLFDKAVKGAPQIKDLGLSFAEGAALMGSLEQAGVDSSATLSSLSKATVEYAKDGKSLSEGLGELQEKILNASSETEAINAAAEIFGTKGGPRMADAIKRGALNLEDLASAAQDSNGVVGATFEETLDPIDKVGVAMNNSKLLLSDISETIQIAFLPIMEQAVGALQKLQEWFGSLSEEQKRTIVVIAGILAAIGPLLIIFGTLMSSVTKIIGGVKAFIGVWQVLTTFLAANPFILVIAGIAALIAGLVWAYKNVEWFRNGVNAFFSGIKDVTIEVFKFIGGFISGVFDGILNNFKNIFNAGKRIFTGFIDFITGIFTGNWKKAWQGVVDIFGGIFDGIVAVAKFPINNMITLINGFIRGLSKIKIPKWVPGVGGKGINISEIPYLAKGGHLINGQAIVGEAGPELLSTSNGKTTVTPLSDKEKTDGISGKLNKNNTNPTINIHIAKVDANNPSDLDRTNRKLYQAAKQAIIDAGGVPV
ncbi:phage tail tape measure protein [Vagococcus fluvialis]|uniref:phage tail tape measure protein n=1 Tax=Vagococcus fluvialis TaxID=2738 RepID=UPI003B21076B